jgi:LysM repeat protein
MSRTPRSVLLRPFRRWPAGLAAGVLFALVPCSARAQAPDTHTVKAGDTLWDLAKQYLGDPFLWPEIYRLNTLVVEDPHWIYPGEVLRLAASEKATAVPQTETPAPVAADTIPAAPGEARPGLAEVPPEQPAAPAEEAPEPQPSDAEHLFPPSRGQRRIALTAGEGRTPPPLHRNDFYSSGFLTENDALPFGRVHGPVTPSQIPTNEPNSNTTLYTKIAVDAPSGPTYQVGDSLLLASVRSRLEGYGRVVEPRGLARVVQISEGTPIAEVIAVYGEILPEEATLPAEKFADPGPVEPVPVADGVAASVIGWPGRRELKGSGVVLFLDKGKSDGVAAGDVFEVRRVPGRHSDGSVTIAEVMATLQVVHVREHTATTRVVGVASPDIPRGSRAVQVAKLPS